MDGVSSLVSRLVGGSGGPVLRAVLGLVQARGLPALRVLLLLVRRLLYPKRARRHGSRWVSRARSTGQAWAIRLIDDNDACRPACLCAGAGASDDYKFLRGYDAAVQHSAHFLVDGGEEEEEAPHTPRPCLLLPL